MIEKKKSKSIALPALRGLMGNWVYYSCLMNMDEIAQRVQYVDEIHQNENLSDMIQRQLTGKRSEEIAEYLKTQNERFFNSLVVATYGGQPNWHALSDVRNKSGIAELENLDEDTVASIGFLTFSGDEKLFALDGQHRLAGIKRAMKNGLNQDPYDELPIIFVAHRKSQVGLKRTRRLFTTLNKTARPVSKGDIIALDEDDVMAICVRRLIEETEMFSGDRIAFVASNNMPVSNASSLTTIGNLYDILTILFVDVQSDMRKRKSDLQRVRPGDEELDAYFKYAERLFSLFRKNFSELDKFFGAKNTNSVVKKYRGGHGGNALFRPIGLEILMKIIAKLSKNMSLGQAVKLTAKLPRKLNEQPYEWLMWDPQKKTISNSHKVTLREALLYMLDDSKFSESILLERYRKDTGQDRISLPEKII